MKRNICTVVFWKEKYKSQATQRKEYLLSSPPSAVHTFDAPAKDIPDLYISWVVLKVTHTPCRADNDPYMLSGPGTQVMELNLSPMAIMDQRIINY